MFDLLAYWTTLEAPIQQICIGAAGEIIGGLTAAKLTGDQSGMILAPFYKSWREGLLKSQDDAKLADAFRDFFSRKPTQDQLALLFKGQYDRVDFNILEDALAASCHWANCSVPAGELTAMLEAPLLELQRMHPDAAVTESIAALRNREPGQRNHSLARRAYYGYLRRVFQAKPLRGGLPTLSKSTHVPLESIYVTPRLRHGRDEPFAADQLLTGQHGDRHVILGGPGSGKTTLLEYLTLTLAEPGGSLLPVYYRAIEYDEDLRRCGGDFWECFHRYLERMGLRLPYGFFDCQGPVALLLDGLDEVALKRRQDMTQAVGNVEAGLPPGSRVVVTSRPAEYEKSPVASGHYHHSELQDFDDGEVQACIENWRRWHEASDEQNQRAVVDLWERVKDDPGLRQLAGNPLTLTMILLVHWNRGQLPHSRLLLYKAWADCLLDSWETVKGLTAPGLSVDQKWEFLGRLAFHLQSQARPGELNERSFALRITRTRLAERLEEFLRDKGRTDTSVATDLVNRFVTRDAILAKFEEEKNGTVNLGFFHRQFQEFFAAWHIAEKSRQPAVDIRLYLEDPGWRETLCMAVAKLPDREREPLLIEFLMQSRADFALQCVTVATAGDPTEGSWLERLVRFLAKYTWAGRGLEGMAASDCANNAETRDIVTAIFTHRRDARVMAAALELAESCGMTALVEGFLSEYQEPPDMVPVPAGEFLYQKGERITLPAFEMDRHPVTNLQFEQMLPGHVRDQFSSEDHQPVVNVNWYEARLYARWRGARLPDEREWEKTARGTDGREYPWLGDFDKTKCNTSESGLRKTTPVGTYPQGASPYGCQDMAGNVWEWTETWFDSDQDTKVLRGGSWSLNRGNARCAYRDLDPPAYRFNRIGFRCARTT